MQEIDIEPHLKSELRKYLDENDAYFRRLNPQVRSQDAVDSLVDVFNKAFSAWLSEYAQKNPQQGYSREVVISPHIDKGTIKKAAGEAVRFIADLVERKYNHPMGRMIVLVEGRLDEMIGQLQGEKSRKDYPHNPFSTRTYD